MYLTKPTTILYYILTTYLLNPTTTAAATTTPPPPAIPINLIFYSGSPGPKDCRGSPVMNMNLADPPPTVAQCYNVPHPGSSCQKFTANKGDGCEARLYASLDCQDFMNVAVFVPEAQPMGGNLRSFQVACGIEGVEVPPLNLPGLSVPSQGQTAIGRRSGGGGGEMR